MNLAAKLLVRLTGIDFCLFNMQWNNPSCPTE
jgi:hypothetical protein